MEFNQFAIWTLDLGISFIGAFFGYLFAKDFVLFVLRKKHLIREYRKMLRKMSLEDLLFEIYVRKTDGNE